MLYEPNTVDWPVGSLVFQEADEKEPTMLMQVIGKTSDGLVKTRYVHPRFPARHGDASFNETWFNDKQDLLDPAPFGVVCLPIAPAANAASHEVLVLVAPGLLRASYADGVPCHPPRTTPPRTIVLPKGCPAAIGNPDWPVEIPAGRYVSGILGGVAGLPAVRFLIDLHDGGMSADASRDGRTWRAVTDGHLDLVQQDLLDELPRILSRLVTEPRCRGVTLSNAMPAWALAPADGAVYVGDDLINTSFTHDVDGFAPACEDDSPTAVPAV